MQDLTADTDNNTTKNSDDDASNDSLRVKSPKTDSGLIDRAPNHHLTVRAKYSHVSRADESLIKHLAHYDNKTESFNISPDTPDSHRTVIETALSAIQSSTDSLICEARHIIVDSDTETDTLNASALLTDEPAALRNNLQSEEIADVMNITLGLLNPDQVSQPMTLGTVELNASIVLYDTVANITATVPGLTPLGDTGAGTQCLSESIVVKHNLIVHPLNTPVSLSCADNRQLEVLGWTALHVQFIDYVYITPVFVIRNLSKDLILGTEFFEKHGAVIDFNNHTVTLSPVSNAPSDNEIRETIPFA